MFVLYQIYKTYISLKRTFVRQLLLETLKLYL